MLKDFLKDPYYLLKYYLTYFAVLIAAIMGLCWWRGYPFFGQIPLWPWVCLVVLAIQPNFFVMASSLLAGAVTLAIFAPAISPLNAALIPLGIYVGILSALLMHNTCHKAVRPLWLNRFLGELSGLQQLLGFKGWVVTHLIHHTYPDDPVKDPHPPQGMAFLRFTLEMKNLIRRCITQTYFETFGDQPKIHRLWSLTEKFLIVNRFLRALFWLLLLGPAGFVCFFLPSLVANVLLFSHFNYATHGKMDNGTIVISDLNHNLFYKFLNFVTCGSYFHKTHHRRPYLFNPMKFALAAAGPNAGRGRS